MSTERYLMRNDGATFCYTDALAARSDMREIGPVQLKTLIETGELPGGPIGVKDDEVDLFRFTKEQLVEYADGELDIKLSMSMSKPSMLAAIVEAMPVE